MKKVLGLLFAVCFVVTGMATASFAEEAKGPVYGTAVGSIMAPVKVKSMADGKEVSTAELAAKGEKTIFVLVNSVCSQCRKEMATLQKYKEKVLAKAGLYLVAVDMAESVAKNAYAAYAADFPVIQDPDFEVGQKAAISSTPATLVLGKDGKILYKAVGFEDDSMKKLMDAL